MEEKEFWNPQVLETKDQNGIETDLQFLTSEILEQTDLIHLRISQKQNQLYRSITFRIFYDTI